MSTSPNAPRSNSLPPGFHLQALARVSAEAQRALRLEVDTFPKPGLVSHKDNGSHTDMDASTFHASTIALGPFFAELASAGFAGSPMSTLREIGLRAESAMLLATKGINTHRGAIFGLGLLCAAAGSGSETAFHHESSVARKAASARLGGPPALGFVHLERPILPNQQRLTSTTTLWRGWCPGGSSLGFSECVSSGSTGLASRTYVL